ncbi:MAG: lycopene beta-cyclase [Marinoscillum sp.]|jgi:lycopene beta-cyclase
MIYDYIVAGAGLGGLSFIHHLIASEIPFASIMIIDHDTKNTNDRTWSFWTENNAFYKCAQKQHWSELGFASDDYLRFEAIAPYTYYTIHSKEFYQEVFDKIRADKRITFLQEKVSAIIHEDHLISVQAGDQSYHAEYLIDSITKPKAIPSDILMLSQNFVGWTIQTERPVFDRQKPILMDFRVAQQEAPSFVYFLPYSENEALVEYTQFSTDFHFNQVKFESELENYILDELGITSYTIIEREKGNIPMTNYPFDAKPHKRVFRIGTVGGDTKATTGYTFMNVQKHAKSIIQELLGHPETIQEKGRFDFYDTLLLQIMKEQPLMVKKIMEFLFKNQPIARVLKFLDEETTLPEEMMILGQLPWQPFLSTLMKRTRNAVIS